MRISKISTKLTIALAIVIFAVLLIGLFTTQQTNLVGRYYRSIIDHPIERRQISAELQHEFAQTQISALQMQLAFDPTETELHRNEMLASIAAFEDLAMRYNQAILGDPNLSYTSQRIMLNRIDTALILIAAFHEATTYGFPASPIVYNQNANLLTMYNEAVRDVERDYAQAISFGIYVPLMVGLSAIFQIIFLVIITLFIIRTVKPIKQLVVTLDEISNGNFEVKLDSTRKSNDEFDVLSESITRLQKTVSSIVRDTLTLAKTAARGHLEARGDESLYKGSFREVIESVNRIVECSARYLDNINGVVLTVDKDYKIAFMNKYTLEQGYGKELLGKSICEALPSDPENDHKKNFELLKETGQMVQSTQKKLLPTGETIVMDYAYRLVKNIHGKIMTFMLVGYDVTALIRAREIAEKVKTYQGLEAFDMKKKLAEGVALGIIK